VGFFSFLFIYHVIFWTLLLGSSYKCFFLRFFKVFFILKYIKIIFFEFIFYINTRTEKKN